MGSIVGMPGEAEPFTVYGVARFDDGVLAEAWLADTPLLLLDVFGAISLTDSDA